MLTDRKYWMFLLKKKLTCEIEQVDYPTGTVQVTLDAVGVPCYEIKEGVAWDNIPFTDDLKLVWPFPPVLFVSVRWLSAVP